MMQIFDDNGQATGDGCNDWKFGWFEPRADCEMDQYNASKSDTLGEIRKLIRVKFFAGNFGAYCIANDPNYPFYIVDWIGETWQVDINEESEEIIIGSQKFVVHEGDWICRGIWLQKLDGTRNWHTITADHQECVVRLETVLMPILRCTREVQRMTILEECGELANK